jgi:hypothetical protein
MKTRKQFDRTHTHLNAAQLSSAYHLTQIDGWSINGLELTKDEKTLFLHENGNALESPAKLSNS